MKLTKQERRRRARNLYFSKQEVRRANKGNKKSLRKGADNKFYGKPQYEQSNILLPEEIDIYNDNNRMTMAAICKKIRFSKAHKIFLDFSQVKKIFAAGMLLLYAEVVQKKRTALISCNSPAEEPLEKTLRHIRFFDMMSNSESVDNSDITEENIVNWHVAQGSAFEGEKVDDFISRIVAIPTKEQQRVDISIREIIFNAIEHAYPESQQKTWVMFGQLDDNNRLTIVIGDLGVGIPRTIVKNAGFWSFAQIKKWSMKAIKNDSALIALASEPGQTSVLSQNGGTKGSQAQNRGKGLPQAIKNIKSIDGHIYIYSRRGYAEFYTTKERDIIKKGSQLKNPIRGTIIEMSIPVSDDWSKQK